MVQDQNSPRFLVGVVLHELAIETETLLLMAKALEDRASGIPSNAHPQKLLELAVLVKGAALQLGMAAANVVGSTERLRIVAEFADVDSGLLPS